jgi:hypothetical protein
MSTEPISPADVPPVAVSAPPDGTIAPRWVIRAMIVLASVLAIGATLNSWVERQLLDTDTWVEVADDMLADPDIRAALSTYLVDEVYANVDVEQALAERLPDDWQRVAGPLAAALRQPATAGVDRLLDTDAVRSAWTTVNRTAHTLVVNILEDNTREGISTADGEVTVDLRVLVVAVAERIGLPSNVIDRIPEDAGQVVVLDSDQLAQAQDAVQAVKLASVLLFVVVVALYAGAVALARSRRRETLRSVGWALIISSLLVMVIQRISVQWAIDELADTPQAQSVASSIASIATGLLRELAWIGAALGVLIVLYAVLIGPSRAAIVVRREIAPLFMTVWSTLIVAAVVVVVYFAIRPSVTLTNPLPRLVLLVLFVAGLVLLHRQVRREHPDASFANSWHRLDAGFRELWNRS